MNNKVFVSNIPKIQDRSFDYRNQISSEMLNEQQQEVFEDILDLFNKSNELEKEILVTNMANAIESSCYSKRIKDLTDNMALLAEKYKMLKQAGTGLLTQTRYAYQASVENDRYDALIDASTSDITAGIISSVSKTRLYDESYDETLIPDSLELYIGPDSFEKDTHVISIEDTDILQALNGSTSDAWIRKVITDTSVESIENELVIGLPEDIITTRAINQIIVKPFPTGYVDITDIQTKVNGAWTTIPDFHCRYGNTLSEYADIFGNIYEENTIQDAGDLKFNFKEIYTNQVKVKIKQRHYEYDAVNNQRIWYLGIRDIDILYNCYNKTKSTFKMVYDFSDTDKDIMVYDTQVYLNNEKFSTQKESAFNITKEYFYYDENGNAHKIATSCPFLLTGKRLLVQFTIEGGKETPNIHKCKVLYKTS